MQKEDVSPPPRIPSPGAPYRVPLLPPPRIIVAPYPNFQQTHHHKTGPFANHAKKTSPPSQAQKAQQTDRGVSFITDHEDSDNQIAAACETPDLYPPQDEPNPDDHELYPKPDEPEKQGPYLPPNPQTRFDQENTAPPPPAEPTDQSSVTSLPNQCCLKF